MLVPVASPFVSRPEISLFDALVRAGEENAHNALPHLLRIVLVTCLLDHFVDDSLFTERLAIDYLEGRPMLGAYGSLVLKLVGEEALLLAGLFPEQAERRNVQPAYFIDIGRAAYGDLADRLERRRLSDSGALYREVAREFPVLARVLRSARFSPDYVAFQAFLDGLAH